MADESAIAPRAAAPAPPSRLRSALRFVVYAAAAGLVAGVAVWLLFRGLGTEGWLRVRAPISWFGLYIAPFALGFLSLARLPAAERGWSSLLLAWLATAVFALGMNLTSLTGPVMLLAILLFVLPASTLGAAAAWLFLRRTPRLPGNPA
jgi:hypothetical protein